MKTENYKLGEYGIIESDSGELGWEAHFGIGALQEGRCYRKGDILFIGPAEGRRDGFLKLEFMAHLNERPHWLKTKSYCKGTNIRHCRTGKPVTKKEMRLWTLDPDLNKRDGRRSVKPGRSLKNRFSQKATEVLSYRLQGYEIIYKPNNDILWKNAGPSTVNGGACMIAEDILFLGPEKQVGTRLDKRPFVANLKRLPEWNLTRYFCSKHSLHPCKSNNAEKEERKSRAGEGSLNKVYAAANGRRTGTFKGRKADWRETGARFLIRHTGKWSARTAERLFVMVPLIFAYVLRLWKRFKKKANIDNGRPHR